MRQATEKPLPKLPLLKPKPDAKQADSRIYRNLFFIPADCPVRGPARHRGFHSTGCGDWSDGTGLCLWPHFKSSLQPSNHHHLSVRRHPCAPSLPTIHGIIFTAASLAAWTVQALQPQALIEVTALVIDWPKVIIAEALFTFALMWVILNVAIAKGTAGNQFYGISIGAIVTAGAYAVGPISFAAFNPAVTLALCINGFIPWSAFPVYCLVINSSSRRRGFFV